MGAAANGGKNGRQRITTRNDNDTARGWYEESSAEERDAVEAYLGVTNADDIAWTLIRAAYTSVAETAIVPAQDILNLGSDARMNMPGEEHHNWSWRLGSDALTIEHAARLRRLAEVSGRLSEDGRG